MGCANRLRLLALNLAIIFIFGPNPASAIHTRTHVHGYSAESNNLGDGQYSSLNGTKRARHLNTNRTHCNDPERDRDPLLKCNKDYGGACIIHLEGHTGRHIHTYVLGHMSIKREESGKVARWQQDQRYFVLNVDACKLSYGQYNDKIDAECEPWELDEHGNDIVLKKNEGHPTRTLDLSPAALLMHKDSIEFATRIKGKGAPVFNEGHNFHVKERETKGKSRHHYDYIGTDMQLYPSMVSLRNVLQCRAFLDGELYFPEYFIKDIRGRREKHEQEGVHALENKHEYDNLKKLMCLMDIPEDKKLELGARAIAHSEYHQTVEMDPKDVLNQIKDLVKSDLNAARGMTNEYTLENLRKVDMGRSVDGFNNLARRSIRNYFEHGKDTFLLGYLSVMVKAMYRDMWSAKFDPDSYLRAVRGPVTFEPLFRGQTESANFVDNMIYQRNGKRGAFAFDRVAGFTDDKEQAIAFFMGGDENRDQRVLFYLEPTAMARPISESRYRGEKERMILPYIPLTVEYASRLSEMKQKDLEVLDKKRFPTIVSVAKHLRASIDQIGAKKGLVLDDSKIHLVVLGVPDVNFVDLEYPMFIFDEEKANFQGFLGGPPTKHKFCNPEDVPQVVAPDDREQDLMTLYDEIIATNKKRREAEKKEKERQQKAATTIQNHVREKILKKKPEKAANSQKSN